MPRPVDGKVPDPPTTVTLLTPPAEGGISVVQLAGPRARAILRAAFRPRGRASPADADPSRIAYGVIVDQTGRCLDEVIVHAAGDVVEVNCHGGILVTRRVIDRLMELGATESDTPVPPWGLAPGLDAVQREAWRALPEATTPLAAAILLDQYHGALSACVADLIRRAEVGEEIISDLGALLATARLGLWLTHPPRVVFAGRPNVGKSSLLNALLGRERALVHPLPGTTRDYLDSMAVVEDLAVVLLDTAGIRTTPSDAIESAGIEKAVEQIKAADLVVLVFDGSEALSEEDLALAWRSAGRELVAAINKSDRPQVVCEKDVAALASSAPIRVSAVTREGLAELQRVLADRLFGPIPPPGAAVIFTARQHSLLVRAREATSPETARAFLRSAIAAGTSPSTGPGRGRGRPSP